MVDVDEVGPGPTGCVWQHYAWKDPVFAIEQKCMCNLSLQIGASVQWEWRYISDEIRIKRQTWDFLDLTAKRIENGDIPFFTAIQLPRDGIHKPSDMDLKERTVSTMSMVGILMYIAITSQYSPTTKIMSINCLRHLLEAAMQHSYSKLPPASLIVAVDLSGPSIWHHHTGYCLISDTLHVVGMDPIMQRFPGFSAAWTNAKQLRNGWRDQQVTSEVTKPLLMDMIVVLLILATQTRTDSDHLWLRFGCHFLSSIMCFITILLEGHIRLNIALVQPEVRSKIRRLSPKSGNSRRIDVVNKMNWLQLFKKNKSKLNSSLHALTDGVVPVSSQKGVLLASYGLYLRSLRRSFQYTHRLQLIWDSFNHTEDTMVFIVWGPAINLAGYPAIQVIQKQSQGDIASNDDLLMM